MDAEKTSFFHLLPSFFLFENPFFFCRKRKMLQFSDLLSQTSWWSDGKINLFLRYYNVFVRVVVVCVAYYNGGGCWLLLVMKRGSCSCMFKGGFGL